MRKWQALMTVLMGTLMSGCVVLLISSVILTTALTGSKVIAGASDAEAIRGMMTSFTEARMTENAESRANGVKASLWKTSMDKLVTEMEQNYPESWMRVQGSVWAKNSLYYMTGSHPVPSEMDLLPVRKYLSGILAGELVLFPAGSQETQGLKLLLARTDAELYLEGLGQTREQTLAHLAVIAGGQLPSADRKTLDVLIDVASKSRLEENRTEQLRKAVAGIFADQAAGTEENLKMSFRQWSDKANGIPDKMHQLFVAIEGTAMMSALGVLLLFVAAWFADAGVRRFIKLIFWVSTVFTGLLVGTMYLSRSWMDAVLMEGTLQTEIRTYIRQIAEAAISETTWMSVLMMVVAGVLLGAALSVRQRFVRKWVRKTGLSGLFVWLGEKRRSVIAIAVTLIVSVSVLMMVVATGTRAVSLHSAVTSYSQKESTLIHDMAESAGMDTLRIQQMLSGVSLR